MAETTGSSNGAVTIQVELFGQARVLTGRRQVDVTVPDRTYAADVAAVLARACPELVGKVVMEDLTGLQESYTFNHNGTAFVSRERLHLAEGDSLLLFSSQAGG